MRSGKGRSESIAAAGRHLPERLVWSIVVEVVAKAVEPGLLLGRRCRRRTGRLVLERAMHALMPSVLLRRARFDTLELDAALEPMVREPGQAAGARRGV